MSADYELRAAELVRWTDAAAGPGGTSTETIAAVNRAIIGACVKRPEVLISGAPNRVPGTVIWWTAVIDHERRIITIAAIEPDPHPGL